jgi:hypothetical protein
MDPYASPPPRRTPPHPQRGAVIGLAVTLAVLLTIWIVGSFLLVQYAPDLGELPGSDPSADATQTP